MRFSYTFGLFIHIFNIFSRIFIFCVYFMYFLSFYKLNTEFTWSDLQLTEVTAWMAFSSHSACLVLCLHLQTISLNDCILSYLRNTSHVCTYQSFTPMVNLEWPCVVCGLWEEEKPHRNEENSILTIFPLNSKKKKKKSKKERKKKERMTKYIAFKFWLL